MSTVLSEIKIKGLLWVGKKIIDTEIKRACPGSISHLLYGSIPSTQSINIKMGHFGEYLTKELIQSNKEFELLKCGVHDINGKKIDVDLLFKHDLNKTIYYRELKGNIELDTEKLPATISKCKDVETAFKLIYPEYTIDCGILNWSVYNREILTAGLSNIKTFEKNGIKIYHMNDFLQTVNFIWDEEDYYSYFRDIGCKLTKHSF